MSKRPDYCCGKCPELARGGYDCTCEGNPRCEKSGVEARGMTPAEVIAMRDKLATQLYEETGKRTERQFLHAMSVADWLIASGWVVAPPKNEGEKNDTKN